VEKYVWNFNGEIIETTTPDELIKTFDRVVTIDSNSTVTLV
jgi:hypothetical protein